MHTRIKLVKVNLLFAFLLFLNLLVFFFCKVPKAPRPGEGLALKPPPPPPAPGLTASEVSKMEQKPFSQRTTAQQEQDKSETAWSPVHTPHVSRSASTALRSGEERESYPLCLHIHFCARSHFHLSIKHQDHVISLILCRTIFSF